MRQPRPRTPWGICRTPAARTPAPGARLGPRLTLRLSLTHFVAGALGFVVAAGRLSLAGWRCPRSPGTGAAPAVPQLQHVPLPRRWLGWRRLAPRHRGAAPGHPQNGINERALEAAGRGCGRAGARRRRCQVRGSTHWPQRKEEREAARPSLAPRDRATRLARPPHLPAAELPQHGHAPQAGPAPPAPPRCTAVPRATPPGGDVTAQAPAQVGARKGARPAEEVEDREANPRDGEALDGAGALERAQPAPARDSAQLDAPRRGGASQASPSRNLLGRTDPLAPRSSRCFASAVPGDELANSFNLVPGSVVGKLGLLTLTTCSTVVFPENLGCLRAPRPCLSERRAPWDAKTGTGWTPDLR